MPRDNGLADSLLVRLRNLYSSLPVAVSQVHQSELLINYRCHPAIVRLPSRLFYDCRIQVSVYVFVCNVHVVDIKWSYTLIVCVLLQSGYI